ncbi:hypothetical protein PoB_005564700 [Plakobranchus ocellatus]|uniref:Uncharacterized protein n=1 Tax=Plakobranchus ocellatus TaxID=259542 RepID=A0AAV4CC65_9GAST|nr:hypothetical protein PoB_005564700 [Plakobranchus ocellatus]
MHAPTPTPVSSRPHTAAGAGDFRRRGMLTNGYRYSQQQQPQQRQHQYNREGIARQVEAEAGRRLKAELGQEMPFSRYVLVTKPKASLQIPLPSPLEEQLLATCFPQQGEKVHQICLIYVCIIRLSSSSSSSSSSSLSDTLSGTDIGDHVPSLKPILS